MIYKNLFVEILFDRFNPVRWTPHLYIKSRAWLDEIEVDTVHGHSGHPVLDIVGRETERVRWIDRTLLLQQAVLTVLIRLGVLQVILRVLHTKRQRLQKLYHHLELLGRGKGKKKYKIKRLQKLYHHLELLGRGKGKKEV